MEHWFLKYVNKTNKNKNNLIDLHTKSINSFLYVIFDPFHASGLFLYLWKQKIGVDRDQWYVMS